MTPKEKAEELINKMYYTQSSPTIWSQAKQCALIAVDEIIELCEFDVAYDVENHRYAAQLNYWDEVKQEIETL